MRTRDGALWLLMWACLGFALVYVAHPPAPVYVVPDGLWQWRVPQGAPAIGWYGRLAVSGLAAMLAIAAGWIVHNLSPQVRAFIDSRRGVYTMTIVVFVTLLAAGACMAIHEWLHWIRR